MYCESCHRDNCAVPPAPPMKVWVVVSDYGMNGIQVHGVYTEEPDPKMIHQFATNPRADGGFRIASTTGYGGTWSEEFEVDKELQ